MTNTNISSKIICKTLSGCEVMYSTLLADDEVLKCIEVFKNKIATSEDEDKGFKGRGVPLKISLRNNLNLIFRRNRRGGLVGKLNSFKYMIPLSFPQNSRPFKEFLCLKRLRDEGVPVPDPILSIVRRSSIAFYEGGLFTKEISQASTLLDLADKAEISQLREYSYQTGLWASRALDLGYLHPDLHLGNVLIRSSGISLIDFDKCQIVSDKFYGIKYLQKRWDRGVDKRVKDMQKQSVLKESFLSGVRYGQGS